MSINMMQIFPEFARKNLVANPRYSFSEWRLMRGRACAFVLPYSGKPRFERAKETRGGEYANISMLIVIDDSDTRH